MSSRVGSVRVLEKVRFRVRFVCTLFGSWVGYGSDDSNWVLSVRVGFDRFTRMCRKDQILSPPLGGGEKRFRGISDPFR